MSAVWLGPHPVGAPPPPAGVGSCGGREAPETDTLGSREEGTGLPGVQQPRPQGVSFIWP